MTIASEITRLQNDKAAICTAIENKWVTVWNVTLDSYAACIDAIEQWWGTEECYELDYLVVAWWWGGSSACSTYWWWGGWAWGVAEWCCKQVPKQSMYSVTVWQWGKWWKYWTSWWADTFECCLNSYWIGRCWWDSWFWTVIAKWWWGWGNCYYPWFSWGSWWWTSTMSISSNTNYSSWISGWAGIYPQWFQWAFPPDKCSGWWWWWAWWPAACCRWWMSRASCISWSCKNYSCWWFWSCCTASSISCQPTYEWSWWSWIGRCCQACDGKAWVVIVRYPTSCGYNFTWWCKYTCWTYTIHCFTSNWALYATSDCEIWYLAVWWWEWWCYWWWWGWDVKLWTIKYDWPLCVTIWNWWIRWQAWWDTTIWDKVVAKWWHCWLSWNNNLHSCGYGNSWWWWAFWPWDRCWGNNVWSSCQIWWNGWFWILWYWWWWGGRSPNNSGWYWRDGWWHWQYWCWDNATNCWWWWGGGACSYSWNYRYKWWDGVVDICYPADWSFWFTNATWGDSCYLCWDICVHRFTSDWTFTIVS